MWTINIWNEHRVGKNRENEVDMIKLACENKQMMWENHVKNKTTWPTYGKSHNLHVKS